HTWLSERDQAGSQFLLASGLAQRRAPGAHCHEQRVRLRRHQLQPGIWHSPMIEGFIDAISVCGPGLDGWPRSRPILAGLQEYIWRETLPAAPSILPANERRRVGAAVRLALTIAQQAHDMADLAPGSIGSLFATSNGDGAVMHAMLQTLAEGEPVSP